MARKAAEGFPREYRIFRTSDYQSIYAAGRKVHSESFVLFGLENSLGHHRLGITVSRRIGSAVIRNGVKRRFREIFRKSCDRIPNHLDFVVNARRACLRASFRALDQEFQSAMRKLSSGGIR